MSFVSLLFRLCNGTYVSVHPKGLGSSKPASTWAVHFFKCRRGESFLIVLSLTALINHSYYLLLQIRLEEASEALFFSSFPCFEHWEDGGVALNIAVPTLEVELQRWSPRLQFSPFTFQFPSHFFARLFPQFPEPRKLANKKRFFPHHEVGLNYCSAAACSFFYFAFICISGPSTSRNANTQNAVSPKRTISTFLQNANFELFSHKTLLSRKNLTKRTRTQRVK